MSHLLKVVKSYPHVLSYASFRSELDLWPLNHALAHQNKLLLPRIVDKDMEIYQVEDISGLITNSLGIKEPDPAVCKKVPLPLYSYILVPGLAFDLDNNRLGYGRGYYDRFLKSLKGEILTLGVGYQEQMIEHIPTHGNDFRLQSLLLF
jgi:5-formyltetrahydrofolate cyclo-ligase